MAEYLEDNLMNYGWEKNSCFTQDQVFIFNKGVYALIYQRKFNLFLIQKNNHLIFKGRLSNINEIKIVERMVMVS